MSKGNGSSSLCSTPRSFKERAEFIPSRSSGNIPRTTGMPLCRGYGNLPPKNGKNQRV